MTRILWLLALLALAIVATFSQLDRQARYAPQISRWVPAPFASFSQAHALERSLGEDQTVEAEREASALVAKRPIPAKHQRWLAQAMLANGDKKGAALAIQRAAQHGWRDLGVQQSMLVLAMQAEDHEQAALHLAALWALAGERDVLRQYSPAVLEQPAARLQFAEILASARWRRNFLTHGPLVLPADLFAETLTDSLRAGATFDCQRLDNALQRLPATNRNDAQWAGNLGC